MKQIKSFPIKMIKVKTYTLKRMQMVSDNHERTVRKKTGGAQYKSPKISVRWGDIQQKCTLKDS